MEDENGFHSFFPVGNKTIQGPSSKFSISRKQRRTQENGTGDQRNQKFEPKFEQFDELTVPRLHSFPLRKPLEEELDSLNAEGIAIKRGTFSKTENAQIKRNFDDYVSNFGGSYDELFGVGRPGRKVGKSELAQHCFYQRLAHGLPDRHIWYVYLRARKVCHPNHNDRASGRQRPYTSQETKQLVSMHKNGLSYAAIGEALDRSPASLCAKLKRRKFDKSRPFDEVELLKLIMCVSDFHGARSFVDARHLLWRDIDWSEVSRRMETRGYDQCRNAWQAVVLLPCLTLSKAQTYFLFCLVWSYSRDCKDASELPWQQLAEDIGVPDAYLARTWFQRKKRFYLKYYHPEINISTVSLRRASRKVIRILRRPTTHGNLRIRFGLEDDDDDVLNFDSKCDMCLAD